MTFKRVLRCFGERTSASTCSSSTSGIDRKAGAPALLAVAVFLAGAGCAGVAVKRDLSSVKPTEVVFDDLCGLQEYFDALKDPSLAPPVETFARDLQVDERSRPLGGRKRFRFENEFQLHYLRKVLDGNWSSVPMEIAKASKIELEVSWSEKAGVARVVTDEEALLAIGPQTWALPYHVCLSDLLFGESLYDSRRAMLQLPDAVRSPFSTASTTARPVATTAPLPAPAMATSMPVHQAGSPEPATVPIGGEQDVPGTAVPTASATPAPPSPYGRINPGATSSGRSPDGARSESGREPGTPPTDEETYPD
jgi:hypothetical protein